MVPMAPSSTRMRSAARRRSVASLVDSITDAAIGLRSLGLGVRTRAGAVLFAGPQSQQVADRVDEVGAVHGVEVEVGDAVVYQIEHLLGVDAGGDQLA